MKVSVCMITYNHQEFIAHAIEAVLGQITTFQVELVIGEDRSRDITRQICQKYKSDYPDRIKLVISESNVGMTENFFRTYTACDGDYIAYCEGDDYWTDSDKLQKQVDFLQQNPELSACFHNVHIRQQRNGQNHEWVLHQSLPKQVFNTEDILGPWFIPSPSMMFVNYRDFDLPDWFHHCKYGDLPFMLLLSLRGDFGYIPESLAVYRLHDNGMSVAHKNYEKVILMTYIYESFNIYTKFRFRKQVVNAVAYEIDRHIVALELEKKMPRNFLSRIRQKLSGKPVNGTLLT